MRIKAQRGSVTFLRSQDSCWAYLSPFPLLWSALYGLQLLELKSVSWGKSKVNCMLTSLLKFYLNRFQHLKEMVFLSSPKAIVTLLLEKGGGRGERERERERWTAGAGQPLRERSHLLRVAKMISRWLPVRGCVLTGSELLHALLLCFLCRNWNSVSGAEKLLEIWRETGGRCPIPLRLR